MEMDRDSALESGFPAVRTRSTPATSRSMALRCLELEWNHVMKAFLFFDICILSVDVLLSDYE